MSRLDQVSCRAFARIAAAVLIAALALTLAGSRAAFAAGSAHLLTPTVQESGTHDWTVKVRIDLAQPPSINHYTIRFIFAKVMHYENTIEVHGQPPVLHDLAVDPPTVFKDDQVVDFRTDPNSGRITKSVIWELQYKRADGFFEAGAYQLKIVTSDGEELGTFRVKMNGDNPPVDRAAIGFDSKVTAVPNALDAGTPQVASNDDNDNSSTSGGTLTGGNAAPMVGNSAFQKTPEEIGEKPHACGCSVPGLAGGWGLSAVLGLAVGASIALARRRRP